MVFPPGIEPGTSCVHYAGCEARVITATPRKQLDKLEINPYVESELVLFRTKKSRVRLDKLAMN